MRARARGGNATTEQLIVTGLLTVGFWSFGAWLTLHWLRADAFLIATLGQGVP